MLQGQRSSNFDKSIQNERRNERSTFRALRNCVHVQRQSVQFRPAPAFCSRMMTTEIQGCYTSNGLTIGGSGKVECAKATEWARVGRRPLSKLPFVGSAHVKVPLNFLLR